MRLSFFPSLALHIGAVAVFLPAFSKAWETEGPPMMILPVELLEIADMTNMTAASEAPKEEAPEPEAAPPPAEAAPPPPPPEPEEEILPTKEAPPPKKEEKKEEKKPEKLDRDATLKDLLAAARSAPVPAPKSNDAPAATEGAPRMSVGDRRRMTMTVADAIRQQMIDRGCWTNQADMADARRLRAVIAIKFGRDGHFLGEPRLVEPTREPSGDPPLQVYIQRARTGLSRCNQLGFEIPEQYFQVQPPQTIELEFRPCPPGMC
jgi:outer membrane biosynthesis protein TonB